MIHAMSDRPVCVIVGAGEGLGRSLAARFAVGGCDIALVSRTRSGSEPALGHARAANGSVNVRYFAADATRPVSVEDAMARVAEEMGAIEILIYNARGDFIRCDPLDMTYDQLEEVFQVEVMGAFAAARSVLPAMREKGSGTIMFSSATAAFRGSATHPLYAIGKFALRALAQSLAKAHARDGVHVVHMRLDCDLDVPVMRKLHHDPAALADPDGVADSYWWVHRQPPSAWSNEVELRPFSETWTI